MKLRSRIERLESAVEDRRPAVLFFADDGLGLVRSSAAPGALTPEEAEAAKSSSGARVVFHITYPPQDPTPGPTYEELMAENSMTAEELAARSAVEPDPPPEPPPEREVDPDKARALVMEALRRAVSGRDMTDLDVDDVYRKTSDDGP